MSKRPHTVGIIGHIDHGKTSLTAAITHLLAQQNNHGTAGLMSPEMAKDLRVRIGSKEARDRDAFVRSYLQEMPTPNSWYCEPCAVEVYDRACKICGKTERQRR